MTRSKLSYCSEILGKAKRLSDIWSLKVPINAVNSVETEAFEQAIFGERRPSPDR